LEPIWYFLGFNICFLAALMLSGRFLSQIAGKHALRRLLLILLSVFLLAMLIPQRAVATVIVERYLPSTDPSVRVPFGIDVAINSSFVVFAEKHSGMIGFMGTGQCLLNGIYNTTLAEFRLPGDDWRTAEPRDVQLGNLTLQVGGEQKEKMVWFTEFVRNRIGVLDLTTGRMFEWTIPTPNSGPMNLAIDPYNGSVWFVEYQANKIGKLFLHIPSLTWKFVEYSLPTPESYPTDISVDPNYWTVTGTGPQVGKHTYVWFTMQAANKIGRVNSQTGLIDEYSTRGTPWGIIVDQEAFVWFTQKLGDRLAKLNPWTGIITEVPLPVHSPGNEPLYLANDTDRCIWFTESASNRIGRYIPGFNVFQEFVIPTDSSKPHGIAVTPRLWSGSVGPGVHPDHVGKINVFFAEEVANKIGKIALLLGPWTASSVGWVSSASTTTSSATTLSTGATASSTVTAAAPMVTATRTTTSVADATVTIPDILTILETSTTSTWTKTTTSTSITTTTSTSTSVTTTTSTTPTTTTQTSTSTSTSLTTTSTTTTASTTYTSTSYSPTITTLTTLSTTSTYLTTTTTTTTPTLSVTSVILQTTTLTTSVTVTATPSRACVIASAAYGSQLAPEVQLLREFRDGAAMSTFAGAQFMKAFNAFYYSFSPKVAELVAGNPTLQAIVRVLIYPLVASLRVTTSVYQLCPQVPELMVMVAGILASALVGVAYVSPIVILLKAFRRRVIALGGV